MDSTLALHAAALLLVLVGLAHSYLGERYILIRLLRRPDLPRLFGGSEFTSRTLRFAWHITTIAWWGLAAVIVLIARDSATGSALLGVLAATSLASAVVAAVGSRFHHLSWVVFTLIGGLLLFVAVG